ncbi:ComF family protein [Sanguibacter suarezii]|uniref:ComF family protein n=1 Tax=Sanguibacter suarezii TaxID=60921 RepID=UPI000AB85B0C|nr:ComF family protein [Sanguibacter suarezii]
MGENRAEARATGAAGEPRRVLAALRSAGGELTRLLVPLECGGCGEPDVRLCEGCAAHLAGVRRAEAGAPRLDRLHDGAPWPVLAAGDYTGPVRELVVAWKDRDRADLTAALAPAVRRLADGLTEQLLGEVPGGREIWIVPVPSTPAARRRRGREPVTELARIVTDQVSLSAGARMVRALAHVHRLTAVRDQVGLGVRARSGNLAGTLDVRRRWRPALEGRAGGGQPVLCVLVDDVLTTGATLAECARAIGRRGGFVLAGVVLAATPAPGSRGLSAGASVQAHPQAR